MVEALVAALNRHDLDAFVNCFAPAYRSEQPVHPNRAFVGRDVVRGHWAAFFDGVPDFRAEVIRTVVQGDTEWIEWRWYGTLRDGGPFDVRGVVLLGVQDGSIVWGRLYMEPVETESVSHRS